MASRKAFVVMIGAGLLLAACHHHKKQPPADQTNAADATGNAAAEPSNGSAPAVAKKHDDRGNSDTRGSASTAPAK